MAILGTNPFNENVMSLTEEQDPFLAALRGQAAGGGIFSGAAAAPAPTGDPLVAAAQGPVAAPAPRSYSSLFDPQASGIRGIIGGIMGNPTRGEYQQQVQGQARSAGFQKLAQAVSAGTPPQKALLDFVNSPEGQQFMVSDADPMGSVTGFLKTIAPAPKDPINLAPGGQLRDPNDPSKILAENQTGKLKDFQGMAALANLSPQEIQQLARAQLARGEGDPTQSEQAMSKLVSGGLIDQDTANKFLAGVISIVPVKNERGEVVGQQVFDASKNEVIDLGQPKAQTPTGVEEPNFKPEDAAPGAVVTTLREGGKNPAEIVMGAGPVSMFGEKIGGFLGNFVPGFTGSTDASNRQGLQIIAADANNLLDIGAKTNRASAEGTKEIRSLLGLDKNGQGGILGVTSNPRQAAQRLIGYNDWLDSREKIATEDFANKELPLEDRGNAQSELRAIQRAKANLPTRQELEAKMKELDAAPSVATQRLPEAEEGLGAAESAVGIGGKETPGEYKTMDDLAKAIKNGTITPKVGDTIMVNGEPVTITE